MARVEEVWMTHARTHTHIYIYCLLLA